MEIFCPKCKKGINIPDSYHKPKGKCPKCGIVIDFLSIDLPVSNVKMINIPDYLNDYVLEIRLSEFKHPIIELFKKHKKKFLDYTGALNTLHEMVKTGKFRRQLYRQKQLALKGKYLSHFIEDVDKTGDFPLENRDKILLWKYLFSFYPYVDFESGSDILFNLYQRYDLAKIIETSYISRGIDDFETRLKLMYYSIQFRRNRAIMETLLEDLKNRNEYNSLNKKVNKLANDNKNIMNFKDKVDKNDLKRIFEDFTYGINWIRVYLD